MRHAPASNLINLRWLFLDMGTWGRSRRQSETISLRESLDLLLLRPRQNKRPVLLECVEAEVPSENLTNIPRGDRSLELAQDVSLERARNEAYGDVVALRSEQFADGAHDLCFD